MTKNNSQNNHRQHFLNQTIECADYFEKWFYPSDNRNKLTGNKKSVYDVLYVTFSDNYKRKTGRPEMIAHNCIGCNFDDSALSILYFLNSNKNCANIEYYLNIYTFLFYGHAERLGVIYKELGFVDGNNKFDWSSFPALQSIKYWANFFKHPKSAMLLHHPDYFIDTDPSKPNFFINEIINDKFIKTYYKCDKSNDELREKLANKNHVKIFYPDLVETTKHLCDEFSKIVDTIISNQTFIDKLEPYTTIESDLSPK